MVYKGLQRFAKVYTGLQWFRIMINIRIIVILVFSFVLLFVLYNVFFVLCSCSLTVPTTELHP